MTEPATAVSAATDLPVYMRRHGFDPAPELGALRDLSTDELIGIAGILLIAGHETTSNMLGLVHHCVGAPLARMEMRLAFPALLRRFPGLAEVPGSAGFRSFHAVYGLTRLQVTW